MAKLGLDPEALKTLQKQLQSDAANIRTMTGKLDGQLRSAWWEGPDAKKFRGEWDGAYKSSLTKVAQALEQAAQALAANITQQTQASAG